jgi:hypothetical protein
MQTAIATVSLSGTLKEKLEAVAAARFKGVEIFENDLLSYNGTPTDVRRMIEDLGLKTITFQPFRDFEGMPEARRARVFQRAERKFDLMQELGCDLLMICSNVSPESLGGIDRAAAAIGRRSEACGSPSRRCHGDATFTTIATPGRRCAGPTIQPSASCSTAFISWHAGRTSAGFGRSLATASFSCRWRTRRCSKWITCRGAAITVISRGRETCRSTIS